ncbi:hypothetical protein GCM10010914_00540 [Deinococcus wulumuqiensis]|uniref:Uncharacterized protein n=1 Tax=Deinococcus wulumuqiensis TaxID=980427 RepID=A0AAV4K0Y8_9DEIO|nr:hypothetical protein GCM10010914_00540 [Deinococcus wulumuqiensis]GGP29575.1 hypothetical protein GCM10008021_12260 [Deinococcus wulumuqiensis]
MGAAGTLLWARAPPGTALPNTAAHSRVRVRKRRTKKTSREGEEETGNREGKEQPETEQEGREAARSVPA